MADKEQLEFFGAIGASLSHEFNNVMAIISEASGLVEDLMFLHGKGQDITPERFELALQRINAQVLRGKDFAKQLNGFSHSIEKKDATMDAREVIESVEQLCRRFARLNEVEVVLDLPADEIRITCDRFPLMHFFFRVFILALNSSESGTVIVAHLREAEHGFDLELLGSTPIQEIAEGLPDKRTSISELSEALGGNADITLKEGSKLRIFVRLPLLLTRAPKHSLEGAGR